MKKTNKKTAIVAVAAMAVMAIGGASAYFTDSDNAVNKLSVGNVEIDLQEPTWDEATDTDKDGVPDFAENVVPTQTIAKDPQVLNEGANSAYIYLTVSVPKKSIITANADGTLANSGNAAVTQLFSFTASSDWTLIKSVTSSTTENVYVYGYNTAVDPGSTTTKLFNNVKMVNAIEGQGLEGTEVDISIEAMGIQSEGTTSVTDAYSIYMNQNK